MKLELNVFVENNPIVEVLIQDLAPSPHDFKSAIAAEDEMFLYLLDELDDRNSDRALLGYFTSGKMIFRAIQQLVKWHFGDFDKVSSLLDFACGYGRLTRFLIQEVSPEKIWVSDIYPEAVQFQSEYFGVHGVPSAANPDNYNLDHQFDCIIVGSLFSHLPEKTFISWMQKLYTLLNPQGLLIFSVLGESTMPAHVKIGSEGILFSSDSSESRSLDKTVYGTTCVTEAFVRQVIEQVSQGHASIQRIPQGMCHYQDFYVVSPSPLKHPESLNFQHHPEGYLDYCDVTPTGDIHLGGWAVDFNVNCPVDQVQIWSQGQLLAEAHPCEPRPDLLEHFGNLSLPLNTGWSCSFPAHPLSPEAIILIKAINTAGFASVLEVMPLKTLTARKQMLIELSQTRAKLRQTEGHLAKTHGNLEQVQADLKHFQNVLEQSQTKLSMTEQQLGETQFQLISTQTSLERMKNQIQAMESSKFWKLRTKWFKLRRALGLSDNEPTE
ncbi:MAG: methyltransferase domain-containing protein [Microcoleaceae cyanobacterium]